MNHLYRKNELTFSLIWIALYVVLFSIADSISSDLGTVKIVTAPLGVIMTLILVVWISKNGLSEKYGLQKIKIDYKKYLYFLPLVVIASVNLWGGVTLNFSVFETVLYIISMICVGFIEEVIFRGFLFNAMCRNNVKRAIVISSLTFGLGHIVNLLNGAEVLETSLQLCYAVALGFLFTIIFYKSKSLIPCVITHSTINSLSTIAAERTNMFDIIIAVTVTIVALVYAIVIIRSVPKDDIDAGGSKQNP